MHIPRTHTDVGLHALDIIHRVLMIDAEWTSQANREFTWLGQRPAQRVTASPCSESREILISRIRVSVPLLDDVRCSPSRAMRIESRSLNWVSTEPNWWTPKPDHQWKPGYRPQRRLRRRGDRWCWGVVRPVAVGAAKRSHGPAALAVTTNERIPAKLLGEEDNSVRVWLVSLPGERAEFQARRPTQDFRRAGDGDIVINVRPLPDIVIGEDGMARMPARRGPASPP